MPDKLIFTKKKGEGFWRYDKFLDFSSFFWFQSKSLRQLIKVLRPTDTAQAFGHVGRIRLVLDNADIFDQLL